MAEAKLCYEGCCRAEGKNHKAPLEAQEAHAEAVLMKKTPPDITNWTITKLAGLSKKEIARINKNRQKMWDAGIKKYGRNK